MSQDSSGSLLIFIIAIAMYVLFSLPVYTLAKKVGSDNAWFAFVPILQTVLTLQIARKDLWWIILFLIPCVGYIINAVVWMAIAEEVDKPSWLGLLMLVPGINVIIPFVIAFA